MRSKIKTAFILGAGLGLRLRPLTESCPKPLLPIGGRPMITYAMDHLLSAGIERFIVNAHHCAEAYRKAFPDGLWRGVPVNFRHEPVLLDTAGGLKNIEDLLDQDETVAVYNGDILSDIPLPELFEAHRRSGKEVTLALRTAGPVCNVTLDEQGRICDMRHLIGCKGAQDVLFTGIYVVERKFLDRLERGRIESVVPVFVRMIREDPGSIASIVLDGGEWQDIGSVAEYERVARRQEMAQFIRDELNLPEGESVRLSPVLKGGSDRTFYRFRTGSGESYIVMWYDPGRAENKLYASISGFLREIGIRVPRIIAADPSKQTILMEDLGETDLWSLREDPWERRRELYQASLTEIRKLHAFDLKEFGAKGIPLMPGFDQALYQWERDYFREQFVKGVCGIALDLEEGKILERELSLLAARIEGEGAHLIHRDFQSQNILIRKDRPAFIDFQGMRQGSLFYDLASLLYDPYVPFREEERMELLRHYYNETQSGHGFDRFSRAFREAACQRLMQALGAYGFLGKTKGKPDFLRHIPAGIDNLVDASGRAGSVPLLHSLAKQCREIVKE